MNKEQIEKASQEYSKCIIDSFGLDGVPNGISAIKGMISDGFVDGAEYRINSVWHLPDEYPEISKIILVEDKEGYFTLRVLYGKNESVRNWKRWAYVSDLLPEGGVQ